MFGKLVILSCALFWASTIPLIHSAGLGDIIAWKSGALLADEMKAPSELAQQDLAFKVNEPNWSDGVAAKYEEQIKQIKVDVVAPNRELAQLMNLVSTKANAQLLADYEKHFKLGNLASTSRPMLLTYLGLKMTKDEQLLDWSKALLKGRTHEKLVKGCELIFRKRAQLLENKGRDNIEQIHAEFNDDSKRLQLVLMIFKNNMNLFLLENYALLCSRLQLNNSSSSCQLLV